ncbi:MAG TPA: cupin domain-containing protein [Acidobacteriaceae bacterium]|nr:cupin domain-containing protein [Acidobacteriaceae bacterium]
MIKPDAVTATVHPAEHPAPFAAVHRRDFLKGTAALYLAALGNAAHALRPGPHIDKNIRSKENTMEIKKVGSQPSTKGPADWFTGTVRIDPLFTAPEPALVAGASVTFEPGARTAWHTHPLGQTLIVTSGCGRAQREGGLIEEIHPGDVIWFAPGEKHWHGAAPTTAMTHIAIQERKDGNMVDWMEYVSDEQYRKA